MEQNVIVLMSTYNGEPYLQAQLESILQQTYKGNITVLIRDDGSSDATADIVSKYPQQDSRSMQLIKASNVGPQRSFLELIRLAPKADFYFFADQDDVWDADKIETAVAAMGQQDMPVCYCSNFRHTDTDLTVYEEKALQEAPVFTPLQVIFYNQIPGCVMGFNWALMALLQKMQLDSVMMHDSMALSLAAACGKVLYDPAPRICHRIHGGNVVGHGHKKIVPHKWIAEKIHLLLTKEDYDLSAMAAQFLSVAEDQMHPEFLKDITLLRDFKKSRSATRMLLRHPDTQGPLTDRTVLSIRCKIFFHLF